MNKSNNCDEFLDELEEGAEDFDIDELMFFLLPEPDDDENQTIESVNVYKNSIEVFYKYTT